MSSKPLSAGDNVEAKCTKCNAVLNHTIVAMVGGRIVRVMCNTCRGEHNYRSANPERPKSAASGEPKARRSVAESARSSARKDPAAAERAEWESLAPGMDPAGAVTYSMTGKFKASALVNHPVFGLGVVKRVLSGKVEILFRDGLKLLKSA